MPDKPVTKFTSIRHGKIEGACETERNGSTATRCVFGGLKGHQKQGNKQIWVPIFTHRIHVWIVFTYMS